MAKEIQVDGVRLQYVEQGSGEPIVFVHGAPLDPSFVGTLVEALNKALPSVFSLLA